MIHVTFNLLFKFPKEGLQLGIDHDFLYLEVDTICLCMVASSFKQIRFKSSSSLHDSGNGIAAIVSVLMRDLNSKEKKAFCDV